MKLIRLAALVTALALPLATSAAGPQPFTADRFRAHVTFLSDDLMEGRETGTRGHELAARYVASQFALMGLRPAGEDAGWYEQVPLAATTITGPTPTLTITSAGGAQSFANGGPVIVRGQPGGGVTDFTAPAVFAGFGTTDPSSGVDDYKGLDVSGKVVVVIRGVPQGLSSEVSAHIRADQARNAAAHGAVAVITITSRATTGRFPWRPVAADAPLASSTWVDKDGLAGGSGRLKASAAVDTEPTILLFQGASTSLDQVLDVVAAGRRPPTFALASIVQFKVTTTARRYTSPEVIGLIPGSDPRLRDQYVVLMAHLDHLGMRTTGEGDRIYNGALDNAAGVATLLEVAHAFTESPTKPKRSILVIANTGEEKGLLGADFFAHHPTVDRTKIVAAIDMDMPVLTYPFIDVVAYGAAHSTLDRSIAKAAVAMNVHLAPDFMPEQSVYVRSDHYPLARAGVPAVMIATGPGNGGEAAWAKFMAQNYHRVSDDMSLPILWDQGARFAELNYRVVRELADQKDRPLWYAGDFFGELFAAGQPKAKR